MDLKSTRYFIAAWLLPIWVIFLYICSNLVSVSILYSRLVIIKSVGTSLMILGVLVFLSIIIFKFPLIQLIFGLANILGFIYISYSMIIVNFIGYRLIFIVLICTLPFSLKSLKNNYPILKNGLKQQQMKKILRETFQNFKSMHIPIIFAVILVVPGIFMFTMPLWNFQTHEFTISDEQAQNTDIVLYYAGGNTNAFIGKDDLLDVCYDYNVTLSIAWHIDQFNDTDPLSLGYEMANFSRRAILKGVKLEFYPCFHFNWEGILNGYYFETADITLDWYEYWSYFKDWTIRESIDVDYILWDIEGGSTPSDVIDANTSDMLMQRIIGLEQRKRELPLVRSEFMKIISETNTIGAKTRITTWDPLDSLDGDHDIQLYGGQIGYVFEDLIQNETIEYVSTMAYTNHWGDIHPDEVMGRQRVYEIARQERLIHPKNVGICIGNINGNGLTTIDEVVGEYRLAVAGGATSVRLFNGQSWVLGWDYVIEGPEWGADGTRDLFEQCRVEGQTRYTEHINSTRYEFGYLFYDIILNIFKI